MITDIRVAATFLVLMFLLSGVVKVLSGGTSEAKRFSEKTATSLKLATAVVFLAGVYEIVASLLVLQGVWMQDGAVALHSVQQGTTMLSIFTVLASLVFYARPFRYKPLLANMTALAGLALLPKVCELRH